MDTKRSSSNHGGQDAALTEDLPPRRLILSPILQLPAELLETIFLYHDSRPVDQYTLCWGDLAWAPSHVCQTWRTISLNLTQLWNRVPCVTAKAGVDRSRRKAVAIVTELLRRSKDSSLSFTYASPSSFGQVLSKAEDPVFDLFLTAWERWDTVHIVMSPGSLARALKPISDRMTKLRRLTLQSTSPEKINTTRRIVFLGAAFLTEATLINYPTQAVALPWKQLAAFKRIGKATPQTTPPQDETWPLGNLKRLELTSYNSGIIFASNQPMPSLTILRIQFSWNSNAADFLSGLSLPALEELCLFKRPVLPLPSVIGLLRSSGPSIQHSLKTLSIRARSVVSGELRTLLEMTPAITKLEINLSPFSPEELRELIPSHPATILLPNLEFLNTVPNPVDGMFPKYLNILRDIARTRCEYGVPRISGRDIANTLIPEHGELRRLKTLRICFGHLDYQSLPEDHCHATYRTLNHSKHGITPPVFTVRQPKMTDSSRRLPALENKLCQCIPTILGPSESGKKGGPDIKRAEPLNKTFRQLENLDMRNVQDLHSTRLPMFMHWIGTTAMKDDIPGCTSFNIKTRALDLLKRWAPLLLENEPKMRWAMLTTYRPTELQYVPTDETPSVRQLGVNETYFDRYIHLGRASPIFDHWESFVPEYMRFMSCGPLQTRRMNHPLNPAYPVSNL